MPAAAQTGDVEISTQPLPTAGPTEDESVIAEREAVDALPTSTSTAYTPFGAESDELVLRHLKKDYGSKKAVRDLCLRVHSGECFGFLGVNGAGKSTTFSMLTGAITPTSGDATLRGLSILSRQDDLRKLVGFCPQHDALEALLTPRETLRLYANIKGVEPSEIESEVEAINVPRWVVDRFLKEELNFFDESMSLEGVARPDTLDKVQVRRLLATVYKYGKDANDPYIIG